MFTHLMIAALGLSLVGCSKVCEPKPLSGEWANHPELVPTEAQSCGSEGTALTLGFEGKSGPHSFLLMTEHVEKLGGWKEVRYGVDAVVRGPRPEEGAAQHDAGNEVEARALA